MSVMLIGVHGSASVILIFLHTQKAKPDVPGIFIKHLKVGKDAIDIHQHVSNQEYLRWMQDVAIEHSTAQGWPMERYLGCGSSWYVKSHYIEYLSPALLGHEIMICTWVTGMSERSSPRRTLFLRADNRQILARAETQWIFVNLRNGRPVTIPDELRVVFDIVESEDEVLRKVETLLRNARELVSD